MFDITPEKQATLELLRKAGSPDPNVAMAACSEFAKAAVEVPLRKVLLSGDIVSGIFQQEDYTSGQRIEYPLDLLTPGQEAEFVAYVIPNHGRIPERKVESDYLMVPTYRIANSIDCNLRYIRDANWPVVQRMMQVLEAGFIKKMNDDGWQTLLAAATDRNILINDPNATPGQFTPRLVTLMKSFMRRNGGGNSATLNRSRLTDLYMSPEAVDDVRAWQLSDIPDQVRTNIFYASDDSDEVLRIFGVNLHGLDEFGEGQEYQLYYTSTLGGTMVGSDVEICVGLDLNDRSSFVNPVRETLQVFEDPTVHRRQIFSVYGWMEHGFSVLDSRKLIIGSL